MKEQQVLTHCNLKTKVELPVTPGLAVNGTISGSFCARVAGAALGRVSLEPCSVTFVNTPPDLFTGRLTGATLPAFGSPERRASSSLQPWLRWLPVAGQAPLRLPSQADSEQGLSLCRGLH